MVAVISLLLAVLALSLLLERALEKHLNNKEKNHDTEH